LSRKPSPDLDQLKYQLPLIFKNMGREQREGGGLSPKVIRRDLKGWFLRKTLLFVYNDSV
jgi:hypothetical protein